MIEKVISEMFNNQEVAVVLFEKRQIGRRTPVVRMKVLKDRDHIYWAFDVAKSSTQGN